MYLFLNSTNCIDFVSGTVTLTPLPLYLFKKKINADYLLLPVNCQFITLGFPKFPFCQYFLSRRLTKCLEWKCHCYKYLQLWPLALMTQKSIELYHDFKLFPSWNSSSTLPLLFCRKLIHNFQQCIFSILKHMHILKETHIVTGCFQSTV